LNKFRVARVTVALKRARAKKYEGVEITIELRGLEEHGAYMLNYRRQGFYPSARNNIIDNMGYYGLQPLVGVVSPTSINDIIQIV